jgi:hypothetical protein
VERNLHFLYRDRTLRFEKLGKGILILEKRNRGWHPPDSRIDHLKAALEIVLVQQLIELPNPAPDGRLY